MFCFRFLSHIISRRSWFSQLHANRWDSYLRHSGNWNWVCLCWNCMEDRNRIRELQYSSHLQRRELQLYSRLILHQEDWTFLRLIGWFNLIVLRMLILMCTEWGELQDIMLVDFQCSCYCHMNRDLQRDCKRKEWK